jgi:hypothetical protein
VVELSPAAQLAAVINQHPNQWCLFNPPLLYSPDYNGNLTSTSGGGVKIPFPIDVFLYYFVFNIPRLTSGN